MTAHLPSTIPANEGGRSAGVKPLKFLPHLEDAALEGRKTKTRRIISAEHLSFFDRPAGEMLSNWRDRPMPYGPVGTVFYILDVAFEITGYKVERLRDISDEDAWLEGCDQRLSSQFGLSTEQAQESFIYGGDARKTFIALWESIHGPGSWAANPYVWVIEFKPRSEA